MSTSPVTWPNQLPWSRRDRAPARFAKWSNVDLQGKFKWSMENRIMVSSRCLYESNYRRVDELIDRLN